MELSDAQPTVKCLKSAKQTSEPTITTLTSERDAADTKGTELTAALETAKTDLAAAKEESKADEAGAAVTFLRSILSNVLVAAGKEKPKDDELPTAVADLEKQIKEHTSDLTAILPVGGVSANPKEGEDRKSTRLNSSH